MRDRRLDLRYIVAIKFSLMKRRAMRKNLALLQKEEFYKMAVASEELKSLHQAWIASGFDQRLSPSVDRKDNNEGYTTGNIQFLTHTANVTKGNHETGRAGHKPSYIKKVVLTKEDQALKFSSGKEASAFLGLQGRAVASAIYHRCLIRGWQAVYI